MVEEKKKSDSEFLSYNLILNSGKKISALRDKKNKYSNSCVVRKKILNETNNHMSYVQQAKVQCTLMLRYELFTASQDPMHPHAKV